MTMSLIWGDLNLWQTNLQDTVVEWLVSLPIYFRSLLNTFVTYCFAVLISNAKRLLTSLRRFILSLLLFLQVLSNIKLTTIEQYTKRCLHVPQNFTASKSNWKKLIMFSVILLSSNKYPVYWFLSCRIFKVF